MQQRKLNTRFLVILTVSVSGLILTLFLVVPYVFKTSAQKHTQMAELHKRQGDPARAAEEYKKAISRSPGNAELHVNLGDMYRLLAQTDGAYLSKSIDEWDTALQVDPAYLPAMQRLLGIHLAEVQQAQAMQHRPRPVVFTRVRDLCQRILAVDPKDTGARANLHLAWVQGWLAGVETPIQQVDASIQELAAIHEADPSAIDIGTILALSRAQRAAEYVAQHQRAEAQKSLEEAEKIMERLVENNAANPVAHLRYFDVMREVAEQYRDNAAKRKALVGQAVQAITKARELAKNEDAAFVEVNLKAAAMAQRNQDAAGAEAIYKDLLAQRHEDFLARLEAARFYSNQPERRQDAIDLLEQNVSDERSSVGTRARVRKEIQIATYLLLAQIRIDVLTVTKAEDEKKALSDQIDNDLKEAYNRAGETWDYLKTKGRYYHAQGKFVEAIQTFNRAAAILSNLGGKRDDDMMFRLAQVYYEAQQTGEARTILEDIVRRFEEYVPARAMLTRIYLLEGNLEAAEPHMKHLERTAPNDPRVVPLLMLASTTKKNDGRTLELLSRMSEGTREEKLAKAKMSLQVRQAAEALRLAGAVLQKNPGDEEAAVTMAQALMLARNAAEARKVVDTALAANPSSATLKLVRAQLDGAEKPVIEAIAENVEEIKEPFDRELARGRLAEAKGNLDAALEHFKKAEAMKPDRPEVWDLLFQCYAQRRQWNELTPYVEKLTKANHDQAGGRLYQFRLAMAKGETAKAVEVARELTVRLPEFAQSWLALGQALLADRKYPDARDAMLRVLNKQAMNIDAYRGLVEACYAMRNYDDAGRYIADAVKRMPGNATVRQMQVVHELNYGQPERVLSTLQEQFEIQKSRPQVWLELGRAYEKIAQRKLSRNEKDARDWQKKVQTHWTDALARWPQNSEFIAHLGDAHIHAGSLDAAEALLKQHAEQVKDRPEPATLLAEFYLRNGQPKPAEAVLRDALQRMPDKVELHQRLAGALAMAGRMDDAVSVLAAAPQEEGLINQRIDLLIQAGRLADASALVQQQIKARGEEYNLINGLAFIALQQDDFAQAKQQADRSLALRPDNPLALQYRAMARYRGPARDTAGAMLDLKLAIQQAPQLPDLRLIAADVCLASRDVEGAIRELEFGAAAAPRSKAIWSRLLELYLSSNPVRTTEARSIIEQARAAGGANDADLALYGARVAQAAGDAQGAVAEVRRAVELTKGRADIVRSYLLALLDAGQNQEAQREAQKVLAGSPDLWWALHVDATTKARTGAKAEAMAQWERALVSAEASREPSAPFAVVQGIARDAGVAQALPLVLARGKSQPRWLTLAASLYREGGDMPHAVAAVEQALAALETLNEQDQIWTLQEAGRVYLVTQPPTAEKAIAVYEKVLKMRPTDLATLNNLACLYVESITPANPTKALEYSQKAYDIMRQSGAVEPLVMDTHGWVLTQTGKVKEGIVMLQEVIKRRPILEARCHLAEAYLIGGFADAALRQTQEAKAQVTETEKAGRPVAPAIKAKLEEVATKATAALKAQTPRASSN